ncbi:MAG TPA: 2-C-methyl-D-erythritol 2,4-cyclodiphosphate synthase, partial [Clostridia bacterium]|nr:2-C-methyl-D-erythritol 2,4-cyclodiphosphate synthase [Clostridia bacterium]
NVREEINFMSINAIIAAGGSSVRYGANKLFQKLETTNIIMESIKNFVANERISRIVIVIKSENVDEMLNFFDFYQIPSEKIKYAQSGNSRSQSVQNAFISLEDDCEYVLVHDAARPFVTAKLIDDVIDATIKTGAAVPCIPMVDSIICADAFPMSQHRESYRKVQTPQGFDCTKLKTAYLLRTRDFSDDLGVFETYVGGDIALVEGDVKNIKVTTPNDIKTYLTGCGYDIHRLIEGGDGIKLGGIFIPFTKSFDAYSDGDVVLHAIMDAALSALGEKDIGHLFPNTDPAYKNADSLILLETVLEKIQSRLLKVSNITATIIAEQPKISPLVDRIRESIADSFGIAWERVGVTATTNEEVGEIGAGNAIACYASILLTN